MRKHHLKHYGFECNCRACQDPNTDEFAAASRERRFKISELNRLLPLMCDDHELFETRLKIIVCIRDEGLLPVSLGEHYLEVARICARKGDMETAVKAAKKALEVYVTCLGDDHEVSEDTAKSVKAFEKQLPKAQVDAKIEKQG